MSVFIYFRIQSIDIYYCQIEISTQTDGDHCGPELFIKHCHLCALEGLEKPHYDIFLRCFSRVLQ